YTAILALSFGVKDKIEPLPGRGIVPTVFLGLSIALAAAYVSYTKKPVDIIVEPSGGSIPAEQENRRNAFIRWSRAGAISYPYFLRVAVICLGIGIMFLPAPYLDIADSTVLCWGIGALIAAVILPFLLMLLD